MKRDIELEITSLALGGDGVGHVTIQGNRKAVFVPSSVPKDRVLAKVDFSQTPARALTTKIITSSPYRKSPECKWSEACGGCDWMHISKDYREQALQAQLAQLFEKNGIHSPIVFHSAAQDIGYRIRARLALHAGRATLVGYFANKTNKVVHIGSCAVLDPVLQPVLDLLRTALQGAKGDGQASLALGRSGLPVISVEFDGILPGGFFSLFEKMVLDKTIAGVSIAIRGAKTPAVIGDPTIVIQGPDSQDLQVASGGFTQANISVSHQIAKVLNQSLDWANKRVVELYCGAGFFTCLLAPLASAYWAVEGDSVACEMARKNIHSRTIDSCKVFHSDVNKWDWPKNTDIVLLDPPRSGCSREALKNILAAKPKHIAYVSCDLSTLGRDLQTLVTSGYTVSQAHLFDMMPQTSRVEALVTLERR